MAKRRNITGQKFGRLTALEYVGRRQCRLKKLYQTKSIWRFRCDCGNIVDRIIGHVLRGDTHSCGCLQKEWRENEFRKYWIILAKGESSFNGLYQRYQRQAKKYDREWEISRELFRKLTKSSCYYCGIFPNQSFLSNVFSNGNYIYMGLDRIDNDRGYIPDNVVPCCGICNTAKSALSKAEFLSLVRCIYERHIKKTIKESKQ